MGYYARLKHGSKEIDLTAAPYCLDPSFVPPASNPATTMSSGMNSNRYAGGQRIERKFADRTMNILVQCQGTSAADTEGAARHLINFLELSLNDKTAKTYFVFGSSNAVPYEPTWGQHFLYYEVKDAPVGDLWRNYLRADVRSTILMINLPLLVAPLATGLSQTVAYKSQGGILEHTWATDDGLPRGTVVGESTFNKIPNPMFGHSTWDTSWTSGADLTESENTDKEYILFGNSSAKLYATGAVTNYWSTSVTMVASTVYFSCYAKLPDGGAIDNTIVQFEYNGVQTETYTPVGNGWYWIYSTDTGVAAPTTFYIYVAEGYTVYVDMVQAENNTFPTPPCYGDMMGVSWVGTAHNSNSQRSTTRIRLKTVDIIDLAESSVRIVWIPQAASSVYDSGGTSYYFFNDDTNLGFWYSGSDSKFKTSDGTTTNSGNATSFSANTPIVFHITWNLDDGITVYINGTSYLNAAYTQPVAGTNLEIGGSSSANGTFLDFTTWARRTLSATEVSDDYDDIYPRASGGDGYGVRINPIPWLWFDDGNAVLDNCYDSSHQNFCVIGGVPGNVPARTLYDLTQESSNVGTTIGISLKKEYEDPADYLFDDFSGVADANACGGEYESVALTTTYSSAATLDVTDYRSFSRVVNFECRISTTTGTSLVVQPYIVVGGDAQGTQVNGEARNITTTTSYRNYALGTIPLPDMGAELTYPISFGVQYKTASGTATLHLDYQMYIDGPVIRSKNLLSKVVTSRWVDSDKKAVALTSSGAYINKIYTYGFKVPLSPNVLNTVVMANMSDSDTAPFDDTMTINAIDVIPRWISV